MKTKKFIIKKETIANLDHVMLNGVKAGGATFLNTCEGIYACTSKGVDPDCPFLPPPGFANSEQTC